MDSMQQPDGAIQLTQYQRDWIADKSQFKLAVKSRQIGVTFATTLEIALDCVDRQRRWRIISRTQDTAKEAIREVKKHLAAMRPSEIEERPTDMFWDGVRISSFVITLPNGSEIQALTAHPDAGRGFPGSFFLDEFGFHRESYELWKGAFPNTMRGHRLIVSSTPHYQLGKFYDLARDCDMVGGRTFEGARQKGIWSRHWIDIFAAAPQLAAIGVPVNVETLRGGAGDADTWAQEFCCQFLSAAEMWIALELIAGARHPEAVTTWDPSREFEGTLFVGADIGRKRDATQIWIDERISQTAYLRGLITMIRTPFEQQFQELCKVIEHPKVRRACIDATGIGMQLSEQLYKKFGMKVEPVTFTREIKEKMAVMVKRRMEEKLDRIPENSQEIERDFAMIKRETTASGNLRFDADRKENSHADIFWAKGLADLAADSGVAAAEAGWTPAEREIGAPVRFDDSAAVDHPTWWGETKPEELRMFAR
jgi:phage FluMu gp28-like protein